MAGEFTRGAQVGAQQGPFGLLIEQISKSQDRRAKEEAQLKQTLFTLESQQQIDKEEFAKKAAQQINIERLKGQEKRLTQAEKPASPKERALSFLAKGETLPGLNRKETLNIAGAGKRGFTLDTSFLDRIKGAAQQQKGGVLPEGVTEEDIAFTMKKRKMTREQVLEALNK